VKWVRARTGEFDVIHFHSGYADYFLVSARLKRIARIPTLHTMYCPIPDKGGRWRLPLVHGLIRRWANQLDWLGAISENVASSLLAYGMRDIERIPPPVNTIRVNGREEADAQRSQLGIGEEEEVILFVGNATKQKNLSGVLRALHSIRKDFPKVKLVITTELKHSSSDEDMTRLSQEMEELDLGSCIIQQGIVDNMPTLMQACDILVAPFLDTLGPSDYFMAALEAMAASRPVVVSNVGGMPEVVTEGVGQLVDPHDPESIASGLKAYLGDAALRERVGMNARRFIEQHFDPREIVAAYDKVYKRIAL
jgi:glycosyltransferase involved in cell wall biosynthesis